MAAAPSTAPSQSAPVAGSAKPLDALQQLLAANPNYKVSSQADWTKSPAYQAALAGGWSPVALANFRPVADLGPIKQPGSAFNTVGASNMSAWGAAGMPSLFDINRADLNLAKPADYKEPAYFSDPGSAQRAMDYTKAYAEKFPAGSVETMPDWMQSYVGGGNAPAPVTGPSAAAAPTGPTSGAAPAAPAWLNTVMRAFGGGGAPLDDALRKLFQ